MERFVRFVVAGGIALVAGLWLTVLLDAWTAPWVAAVLVVLAGGGGLAAGIRMELDY